jgi:hypothetical protein
MRTLALLVGLFMGGSALGQTVTIPAQTACTVVPQQSLCVTLPARTLPVTAGSTPPPPTCTAPQVLVNGVCTTPVTPPPPPPGVTWMYLNGVKTLAGDFTANGETTNYANKTTSGLNGDTTDILITSSVPWGYFLPYWAGNYMLPNPGYTTLIFSIKATLNGDTFNMHAERVGDNPLPSIALAAYCGTFAAGKWTSCSVPLSALGVAGEKTLYKVLFQTATAGPDNWEMDAIGFQ